MAFSAHTDEEMMREHFDSPDVLSRKLDQLAGYMRRSRHAIFFTGAGISTSAGISDFRGPDGVWTRKAQGLKPKRSIPTLSVYPTPCHLAIVELLKQGRLKYLVSQNCDGLHRRSGVPRNKISEMHGNINVELCEDCGKQYWRDYGAYRRGRGRDHFTGRFCEETNCNGRLLESTIDFSQSLPLKPLELAFDHAERADLCVVLGSSCTVSPACDVPKTVKKNGGRLVIINLQKTPLYRRADINIHARTDEVMIGLMERLGLEIPRWVKHRRIAIRSSLSDSGEQERERWVLSLRGLRHDEPDDAPLLSFSTVRKLRMQIGGRTYEMAKNQGSYNVVVPLDRVSESENVEEASGVLTLVWYGHHGEPAVRLPFALRKSFDLVLNLTYDFQTKGWTLEHSDAYEDSLGNQEEVFAEG